MRLLLIIVFGPLTFQDIRKVIGQQYPTFRDACFAPSLLEDDDHCNDMLAEAALGCTGTKIRYSVDDMFHATNHHVVG
jgi:hypothetical protein